MSKRRILAIARDLDLLRQIVDAIELAGAEVDAVASVDALTSPLVTQRYVFVALPQPELPADLLRRLPAHAHVTVVVPEFDVAQACGLLAEPRINHVITHAQLAIGVRTTAQKLLTGDLFGIEKYLPVATPVHYIRLRDFAGRGAAVDTIGAFVEGHRVRRPVRAAIAQVCEELLMNALYDAPIDRAGRALFAEVEPAARVAIPSPSPVSVRYAITETQVTLAVRDRFGRLAKRTMVETIAKCVSASSPQIDRKTYGAGLGLYFVANAACVYVVNVAHGVATEVICQFDRHTRSPLGQLSFFVHPANADRLAAVVPA